MVFPGIPEPIEHSSNWNMTREAGRTVIENVTEDNKYLVPRIVRLSSLSKGSVL
jgi:hypothetical protein